MCGQPALVFGSPDAQAAVRQRDALRRLPLGPPFVERPAADTEIGAHLRDGELVPLPGTADLIRASHDDASQSQRRAGHPAWTAEPTGTAACPSWLSFRGDGQQLGPRRDASSLAAGR